MRVTAFLLGGVLLALATGLQVALEAAHERAARANQAREDTPESVMVPALRLLAVPFPEVAADITWLRAVQYFARFRHSRASADDRTLSALIDLAVTLDPNFVAAYRTGAVLVAEPPPMGPGQAQVAVGLLEKGIEEHPSRWELLFDKGFLQYRSLRKYDQAAASFLRASRMTGAPWWLRPLAASTLAEGGRRAAARALWRAQLRESQLSWMREQAERRLEQLDVLDSINRLQRVVDAARASGQRRPYSWDALRAAGRIQAAPRDPEGTPYMLDPMNGRVELSPTSPLAPLPVEGGFVSRQGRTTK
ncbi:MAG: hypothetical protein GEU99_21805 [Luteitalea sp.]|nr:hypothetical protein [Luteitalea sp.]